MGNFQINKIALQDIGQFPWTLQDWMRSVKRAINGGVYTPTLTNVTNVSASTAYECQWQQIENIVVVSGRVDVDPTAAAATELGISLPPLYPSDFAAVQQCAGTAASPAVARQCAAILADTTNNRASLQWVAVDTANRAMYFTFTYRII